MFTQAVLLLFGILFVLLIGLIALGFIESRGHGTNVSSNGARVDVMFGFLVFAVFAVGLFLTYVFLAFGGR